MPRNIEIEFRIVKWKLNKVKGLLTTRGREQQIARV